MSLRRKRLLWGLVLVISAGSLAACSVSMAGGIAGLVVAMSVALALVLSSASQVGCGDAEGAGEEDARDSYVGPCLSAPWDPEVTVSPCLSDTPNYLDEDTTDTQEPEIGPCLSAPLDDVEQPEEISSDVGAEPEIGPCLSPPLEDVEQPGDVSNDADAEPEIGPCLSPPLDIPTPEDASEDTTDEVDTDFGPCLSPPAPDPPDAGSDTEDDLTQYEGAKPLNPSSREAIIARLGARGVLPPDVLARLNDDGKS